MYDLEKQIHDWQVSGLAQTGGGSGLAGGVWFFAFYSPSAKLTEYFGYLGGGVGVGANIGGVGLPYPSDLGKGLSYSPIKCERPFSVVDLNHSGGRVSMLGAGLVAGLSSCVISAFNFSGELFSGQECSGMSIGVGACGISTVGFWASVTLSKQAAQAFRAHNLERAQLRREAMQRQYSGRGGLLRRP